MGPMARTVTSEPLEGHRLLMARLRPDGPYSQQWLADVLEIGQPSVSSWVRKQSRPEPPHRLALWYLWQIPPWSWLTKAEVATVQRIKAVAATLDVGTQVELTMDELPPPSQPARGNRPRRAKARTIKGPADAAPPARKARKAA